MAPQELVGRYREYKSKTKNLLYWITKTAASCCDLSTTVKSLGGSKNTARQASTTALEENGELEVTTQELLALVEAISSSDPPVEVPEGILLIIGDVIASREGAAAWYSAQALEGDSKMARENDSHRYFIKILRKVLEVLRNTRARQASTVESPAKTTTSSKKNKKKNKTADAATDHRAIISTFFESLEIEEPVVNPLGSAPLSSSSAKPAIPLSFKLEQNNDDRAFKTWCFLQDLADIRIFVKQTWKDWMSGQVSFLAAGLVTDTAFGLLRRADDEFAATSPFGSTDWTELLDYLGISYFVHNNAVWMHPSNTNGVKEPKSDVNIVELLCPVGFLCLQSWKTDADSCCESEKLSRQNRGRVAPFQQRGNYGLHDLCHLFCCSVQELHADAHRPIRGARDEFLRGLSELHNMSTTPIWTVVSCQIYMDIHDLLGFHATYGPTLLREEFAHIHKSHADATKYNPTGQWLYQDVRLAMENLKTMQDNASRCEKVMKSPTDDVRLPQPTDDPDSFLQRGSSISFMAGSFPAHAGSLLADIRVSMYDNSTMFASYGEYVLTVAHVYRALHAMGLLDHTWPDMEHAISAFAPKDPLVAKIGRPYNAAEAERHYLLALGLGSNRMSGKAIERAKRSGKSKLRKQHTARVIEISSPLLEALCDRATKSRTAESVKTFEAVIRALSASDETTVIHQKHQKRARQPPTFTACELLTTLRRRLLHDEPNLNFDFIGLTLDCTKLLKSLASDLGIPSESGIDASFMQRFFRSGHSGPSCKAAATLFRSHIISDGKKYVQSAYDQSSGRIPKRLRPADDQKHRTFAIANEQSYQSLNKLGVKFVLSGSTVATYHSQFDPKLCSMLVSRQANLDQRIGSVNRVLHTFEVPLPSGTWKQLNRKKNAVTKSGFKAFANCAHTILRSFAESNAKGVFHDDEFRQMAENITGGEVIRLMIPEVRNRVPVEGAPDTEIWAVRAPASHESHAHYLEIVMSAMGGAALHWNAILRDAWVALPLQAFTDGDEEPEALVEAELLTERCGLAAVYARVETEPDIIQQRLPWMVWPEHVKTRMTSMLTNDAPSEGKQLRHAAVSVKPIFGPVRPRHLLHEERQRISFS